MTLCSLHLFILFFFALYVSEVIVRNVEFRQCRAYFMKEKILVDKFKRISHIFLNSSKFIEQNEKKLLKNVSVQGPGYTKRPFGHRVIKR